MRKPLREGDARAIRVVDKAFTVLATLAGSDAAAPLEAIADGAGLPQSTAARLLLTMCIRGVVQLDAIHGGPVFGPDASVIAAISSTGPTNRIASERLEEYREFVGRVAGLVSSELTHS